MPAFIAHCIKSMSPGLRALHTYQWRDNNHKLAHDGSWKCKAQRFASCIGMPATQYIVYLQVPCLHDDVIPIVCMLKITSCGHEDEAVPPNESSRDGLSLIPSEAFIACTWTSMQ